ncbi:PilN domain-containing protein [Massilia sp. H6]|uniref:PilN domain-containing protein n=1 Tax=Massilia sp. H6 TaxID=2970464 RepID=UPI0021679A93|nr:PilN domain-containing protein [Massilia sp. H6]UVW26936.1 PilN domain-containing protein [Massilia sp. H6]
MSKLSRQQVNLFNPAFQPQKKRLSAPMMGIALLVLACGIAGLSVLLRAQTARMQAEADAGAAELARKQARLTSVNAQFSPRSKSAEIDMQIREAETALAAMRRISDVLERGELGDTGGYSRYFQAFARQSVAGLWLTGVSIAGRDIGLEGRTTDPALVPGYINRLTREPLLQGKSFTSLQIGQAEALSRLDADGKPVKTPAPYVAFSLQAVPVATPVTVSP